MIRLVLVLTGFAACHAAAQQKPKENPLAKDAQAIAAGQGIFRIYCAACHGIQARGGRGPDLSRGAWSVGETDADLFRIIDEGSPATEMASFSKSLGEENIWRVIAFIRSASKREAETEPGNPAKGETIFWGKGACGQCHRVELRGGRMGPDLSMVGRTRSLKYLRESMVNPSLDIASGYATIEVVTRDGKKIAGVQKGYDNYSAQLVDLRENYYSFFKSDVKSMKREMKSLMPSYEKSLSPGELDDLVGYLYTLGRTKKP
ncbi:MAG TPA: c-type cytochrome [Bryobacteraceae bacterium]|nr:c-type cytochrome [Bryobacteraceae bacterium]